MIGNILDNTTELYMIKYTFGEIFSSGGATLYNNPSDQTVCTIFPFVGNYEDTRQAASYMLVSSRFLVSSTVKQKFRENDYQKIWF